MDVAYGIHGGDVCMQRSYLNVQRDVVWMQLDQEPQGTADRLLLEEY
jgi:hypothetical protein